MASTSLTAGYTGYSIPSSNTSWVNTTGSSEWYVGRSSSTYCGKVAFTTPDHAAATTALSITCVCNQTSNPGYTRGYLMNRDMTSGQMLDGNGYGLEGVSGYLATLANSLSSGNQSAGYSVTYTSDRTISLAPNTTYYIYFFRNGSSYNGFCAYRPNPTVSLTYTARYLISYNANGGTGAPGAHYKTEGVTAYISATKPSRSSVSAGSYTVAFNANGGSSTPSSLSAARTTSYSFSAWNTNSAGTGTNYAPGAAYTANAALPLYAKWTSSTSTAAVKLPAAISCPSGSSTGYTVSFNANGGSSTPSALTARNTVNYTFSSWSGYAAGASYTPTANVTLTAWYTSSTVNGAITLPSAISRSNTTSSGYTVTFNGNGGSAAQSSLTATNTTKYTFSSWSGYAAGTSYTPDTNRTLYAQWTSSTSNGSITLPSASRTGYTFLGWSASSTAASASYSGGASYTPSSAQTLYAVWKANTYTITFDANGGTGGPGTQTYTYADSGSVMLSTVEPSRSGYKFVGWSVSQTAASADYLSGGAFPANTLNGITLYAVWERSGLIHLYNGGSWRNGLVWVFDGTSWRQGIPWVYDGTAWKMGG